ncbi:MAG: homing endonuclease associated repeat-containing protein [Ruminococcus sp.]
MKFELNEYHRNTSDEEFIEDVCKTAKKLNKRTLTGAEYNKYGTYHSSTLTRRFGSWKLVLEKCGLETKGHSFKCVFTDDDVILDLKRVANIYQSKGLTAKEYDKYGRYYSSTLIKRYGTWNSILKLSGMKLNLNRNFTNEEMFEEIERVWVFLGRQPTTTDIKNGVSKFSLQSYARRFGGWRGALQAFVDYINTEDISPSNELLLQEQTCEETNVETLIKKENNSSRKTSRDINLRLRFRVMQRDNFKCCACGASPAKDPAIELHIDHIIPWSKGGETVIENLQTLCSKCNLGKSDII